eukprot:6184564-Pleurochrysis_carterae.AAC.1
MLSDPLYWSVAMLTVVTVLRATFHTKYITPKVDRSASRSRAKREWMHVHGPSDTAATIVVKSSNAAASQVTRSSRRLQRKLTAKLKKRGRVSGFDAQPGRGQLYDEPFRGSRALRVTPQHCSVRTGGIPQREQEIGNASEPAIDHLKSYVERLALRMTAGQVPVDPWTLVPLYPCTRVPLSLQVIVAEALNSVEILGNKRGASAPESVLFSGISQLASTMISRVSSTFLCLGAVRGEARAGFLP